jgi:hypothetical protein
MENKMKVLVNTCFGGFGLSDAAFERYLDLNGTKWYRWKDSFLNIHTTVPKEEYDKLSQPEKNASFLWCGQIERTDPILIQVVEEMGSKKASGQHSELTIKEIPDDIEWSIDDYDGKETIRETHRSW